MAAGLVAPKGPLALPRLRGNQSRLNHSHSHLHAAELLLSWEWDFTELRGEELVKLAYDVFLVSGLVEELDLRPKVGHSTGRPLWSQAGAGGRGGWDGTCGPACSSGVAGEHRRRRQAVR